MALRYGLVAPGRAASGHGRDAAPPQLVRRGLAPPPHHARAGSGGAPPPPIGDFEAFLDFLGNPERDGTGGAAGADPFAASGWTVGSDHPSGTAPAEKVSGAASPTPATAMPASRLPALPVAVPSTVSASATRTDQEALDESDPSDNTSSDTTVNDPLNNEQGTPSVIALGPVISGGQGGGASGGRASSISPRESNAPAPQNEPAPAPPAAQSTPAPQTSQPTPAPQAPRAGLRSTPHHHFRRRKDCHIVSFSNQAPLGDIQPMIGLGLSLNVGVVVRPTAISLALMSKFFLGMKIRMEQSGPELP